MYSRTSEIRSNSFRINRGNESYNYFKNEFIGLPRDNDNNLIYSSGEIIRESRSGIFINNLKVFFNNFIRSRESYIVSRTSDSYMYFESEYRNNICRDINNNIIVPSEKVLKKVM